MPERKLKGLPRSKEGTKFLVIKNSKKDQFIVEKLKRRKK